MFPGISDREIGWDNGEWGSDDVIELFERYYLPEALKASGGKGIVLVGYGGYFGYMDVEVSGGDDELLVGIGGHLIDQGPLVNVPVEVKNRNYRRILSLLDHALMNSSI